MKYEIKIKWTKKTWGLGKQSAQIRFW
jgi:hypothetical protein